MILVDSSVWVDYFRGTANRATDRLDQLVEREPLTVGDLILAEVLQGFLTERSFDLARRLMTSFRVIELGGKDVAIQAAMNFRVLRARGVTVRKTIDIIIATRCVMDGYALLHNDRDFDACVRHLGLRVIF